MGTGPVFGCIAEWFFFHPAGMSEVSNQTMWKSVSRSRYPKIVHLHVKSFTWFEQQLPARLLVQVSKAQGQQVQVIPQFFPHLSGFAIAYFSTRPAFYLPLLLPHTICCLSHQSAPYLLLPRRVVALQSLCFAFLRLNAASLI